MTQASPAVRLTKNQRLVEAVLSRATAPLSAYAILDALRPEGLKAPAQIYRALDGLVEAGLAHRLETLNAYVACSHGAGHGEGGQAGHCARHGGTTVFSICGSCGEVAEFCDETIAERIGARAAATHFAVEAATVELRGRCATCLSGADR
jgi:Fur family zinc uptake transcriptional regulator